MRDEESKAWVKKPTLFQVPASKFIAADLTASNGRQLTIFELQMHVMDTRGTPHIGNQHEPSRYAT